MVVLHFVYMLVMNKKISTFMNQSNDSFKKDVYYRLLTNASYNWRKLLSLSSLKILSLLHKVQDAKLIRVLILDDTVENKVGKNIKSEKKRQKSSLFFYPHLKFNCFTIHINCFYFKINSNC